MFRSTMPYTDIPSVLRCLDLTTPMFLSADVVTGDQSITISQIMPGITIGSQLVIDYNSDNNETVAITAMNDNSMSCTPLSHDHQANVPIVDVTSLAKGNYISAASRFLDDETWQHGGFAYESVTETLQGMLKKNYLTVLVAKPHVEVENIQSVRIARPSRLGSIPIDIQTAWVEDEYFVSFEVPFSSGISNVQVQITYSGGFDPLPADIANAAAVMAARMYKERQSGFGDVVAADPSGNMEYKRAMPDDVYRVVRHWKRWTK